MQPVAVFPNLGGSGNGDAASSLAGYMPCFFSDIQFSTTGSICVAGIPSKQLRRDRTHGDVIVGVILVNF